MSPTGTRIAVQELKPAGGWDVVVLDLRTGALEDLGVIQGTYIAVSPNGRDLAASDWRTGELFERAIRGDTARRPIAARGYASDSSPDGRWLAWGSVTGSVDVVALPPTGLPAPIVQRGQQPLWRPDGRTLVYRDGKRFYEVGATTSPTLRVGTPRLLAEGPFIRTFAWNHTMAPDGRVVALVSTAGERTRELGVVTGFQHELARLAPARR